MENLGGPEESPVVTTESKGMCRCEPSKEGVLSVKLERSSRGEVITTVSYSGVVSEGVFPGIETASRPAW